MHFYAKLNRNSHIYTRWMSRTQANGLISGVLFKKVGRDFVTDELDDKQVTLLVGHEGVTLEGASVAFMEPKEFSEQDYIEPNETEQIDEPSLTEEEAIEEKPVVRKMKEEKEEVYEKPKRRGRPPKSK